MATDESHLEEDHSTRLIILSNFFTGVAAVLFVLRILARHMKRTPLALDDHLAMVATIFLLGMDVAASLMAHYGIGRHLLYVQRDPQNLVRIGKSRLAFAFLYPTCVSLSKLSILALIVRIFGLGSNVIRIGTYINVIWIVLLWIGITLTIAFQCQPLSSNWGEPYTCVSSFAVSIVGGVLDALSDVGALVLPQPTIWSLQLSFSRKLAISLVFLFGTLYVSTAPCVHAALHILILTSFRQCHYHQHCSHSVSRGGKQSRRQRYHL